MSTSDRARPVGRARDETSGRREKTQRLGAKVRTLRRRENLSQADLAQRLGISASYLNLIENNNRPLPAPLLIRLAQLFGVELHTFAADEDSRLTTALFEALSDPLFESQDMVSTEVRELATASPGVARAVLTLYRSYQRRRNRPNRYRLGSSKANVRPGSICRTSRPKKWAISFNIT